MIDIVLLIVIKLEVPLFEINKTKAIKTFYISVQSLIYSFIKNFVYTDL